MNRSPVADVILLHGLWMPGLVMSPLASRLAARGYRTHVFDYATRRPIDMHADRLGRFANSVTSGSPAHFVGHSLGGLVILEALARDGAPAVASVVLLGTPVKGCVAGRRLGIVAPGRWMLGESQALWKEGRVARWDGRAPLGIVAGTRPSIGLGRMLGRLPGVNDGVVCIEETEVGNATDRVELPVGHTELIFSSRVESQTAHFLAQGRFQHDE
jgi:pimeloyl-ACP methyl ester carboxylesterase